MVPSHLGTCFDLLGSRFYFRCAPCFKSFIFFPFLRLLLHVLLDSIIYNRKNKKDFRKWNASQVHEDHRKSQIINLGRLCWFVCWINRSNSSDLNGCWVICSKFSNEMCNIALTRSIWNVCVCAQIGLSLFIFFGKWFSGCLTAYYT